MISFPHPSSTRHQLVSTFRCFAIMTQPATIICPLCNDTVEKLLYRYHFENERQVIKRIREQNPAWSQQDGACSRCMDYYHTELVMQRRMLPEIGPHFPVKSVDDFIILPTGLRLDSDPRFTGKGVTICFIDSGFYVHHDLTVYKPHLAPPPAPSAQTLSRRTRPRAERGRSSLARPGTVP